MAVQLCDTKTQFESRSEPPNIYQFKHVISFDFRIQEFQTLTISNFVECLYTTNGIIDEREILSSSDRGGGVVISLA